MKILLFIIFIISLFLIIKSEKISLKKLIKKLKNQFELSDSEISYVCATTQLNVRSCASTSCSKVGILGVNEKIELVDDSVTYANGINWIKINYNYQVCYVAQSYTTPCSSSTSSGNGLLSTTELKNIMPNTPDWKVTGWIDYINEAMKEGEINTCCRMSAFLAQLAHESGELRYMEEIASGSAYEGRKDLGNIYPGDGKKFKGRGPIQLTGRSNYRIAGKALGLDLENNPEIAAHPDVGFRIAAWYWTSRNLNSYADCSSKNFDIITKKINGGYNGKADRDQYFAKARKVLGC